MYKYFFKRVLDLLISTLAFVILLPFFLIIVILLFFLNKGSVFFLQKRAGKDGILFNIIKFKTMNNKTDEFGNLLPDDKRLTYIGSLIRRFSLDELPQLINVIKNDMSLIGPRPFLSEYLSIYSKRELDRLKVKPGITGWAQINGRNAISWKEKFRLDIWYVEHISFSLDLQIFFKTILNVLKAEGISSEHSVTMEKYNGYN